MTAITDSPVIEQKEVACDVLVVGMGFGGLVSALRALENGAKVIAIDKQPRGWWTPGGSMILAGGRVHLSTLSLALPPEQLAKQVMATTDGMIPPELLEASVSNAGRSLKWLIEKGAQFVEGPGLEQKIKPPLRTHVYGRNKPGGCDDAINFGNKQLALRLESAIKEKGGTIIYETKALKLLVDASGRVSGVLAHDKDGRFNIRAGGGVILCTGGYEQNAEMLVKYVGPRADEIVRFGGPGCTGDGLEMCAELGANLRSMNHAGFSHYYSIDALRKEDLLGAYLEDAADNGIVVNGEGERFLDEGAGCRIGGSIMAKTTLYKKAWIIIDSGALSVPEVKSHVADVREFGGTVYTANTVEQLGREAGISPKLVSTVGEFNNAVNSRKTALLSPPRTKDPDKVSMPPFYAIPFVPGIVATYGGLLVNGKAQVVDRDKKPIPGLYAAGLLMEGSLSGGVENESGAYVGCLSACLIFGILAAEHASAR